MKRRLAHLRGDNAPLATAAEARQPWEARRTPQVMSGVAIEAMSDYGRQPETEQQRLPRVEQFQQFRQLLRGNHET